MILGISCSLFNDMLLENNDCYEVKHNQKPAKPSVVNYQDDAQWPDLYLEADEMMESLVLLSALLQIRTCRMDAINTTGGRMSQVPISHAEIMNFLIKNQAKLPKRKYGEDSPLDMTKQRTRVTGTTILYVHDQATVNNHYNYSISINHQRKRVTVCFRHSKLTPDNESLAEVINPTRSIDLSRHARVALNGSLVSLVNPSLHESKQQSGTHVWSEFQKILDTQLCPILEQSSGYKIYATGFNNGAALATLFAFYTASQADATLSKPVSLITFGSPYVGDQSFRDAHQCLEATGRLRHLRISNHMDYTPLTPQLPLYLDVFHFQAFKHVGIHLKLFDGLLPPEITFGFANNGLLMSAAESLLANMPLNPLEWPEHNLKDYVDRLLANKALLEGVYLNQFYDPTITSFGTTSVCG